MTDDTASHTEHDTPAVRPVNVRPQAPMGTATYRPVPASVPPVDVQAIIDAAAEPLGVEFVDDGSSPGPRVSSSPEVTLPDGRRAVVVRLPGDASPDRSQGV